MSKQSVSMEKTMNLQETIAYLEELVTSLKVGRIEIAEGEKRVILCLPNVLDVEVEAKHKKDKQKLTLELSWKNQLSKEDEEKMTINTNKLESIEI